MKKYIGKIILLFIVAGFTLTSCSKNDDAYSLGDIWLSLGMVETENAFGYDYIIYCDNGDTLLPAANNVPYFKTVQQQRVLINYTILDEVGLSTKKFYVKINNLQEILFKDLIEVNSLNSDSLGNDSVAINEIWIVNDMLNIDYQYIGGITQHYINLAYTTDEDGNLAEPVELEFRHNANNDQSKIILNNIVTFQLDKLKIEGQNSTDFVVKAIGLIQKEQSFSFTYEY